METERDDGCRHVAIDLVEERKNKQTNNCSGSGAVTFVTAFVSVPPADGNPVSPWCRKRVFDVDELRSLHLLFKLPVACSGTLLVKITDVSVLGLKNYL